MKVLEFIGLYKLPMIWNEVSSFYTEGIFPDFSYWTRLCDYLVILLIFWHSHHQLVCLNPKEQIHLSWEGPNATLLHMFEVDFYMFSIFFFLQYLAVGTLPGRLPIPCVNLNFLSLRINFNDAEEVLTALCLLRSSPNLQELEILVSFFYWLFTLALSKST